MPLYDFRCDNCKTIIERRCLFSERESQRCEACASPLDPQFSLNSNVFIPERFRHSISELWGTSSEKDYLKEHPNLIPYSETANMKTKRERDDAEAAAADAYVTDVNKALRANKTLRSDGRKNKKEN